MACDADDCGFQMLNVDEIMTSMEEESYSIVDETNEDEDNNNESHGSLMAKITNSWPTCHEFEPNTTEDPPCRGAIRRHMSWHLSPVLTTTPHQWALDRFNVHRSPTRRVFNGIRLELMRRRPRVRYLDH
ncbi:hypothetical protein TNCV_4191291 [Trichonephila clavipes]|nr:hypothetical protein TNCV_4191291 [Trichonephila clavipes]